MKKSKLLIGVITLGLVMVLVAGCGSSEKPAAHAPADNSQQPSGHAAHSATMLKEDPMPFMQEMDKALQDVVAQVKAGKIMDAQASAVRLVSTAGKVQPHMMDDRLKGSLRQAAADIKTNVNSGRIDLRVLEEKAKAMQEIMQQTTAHLQTMNH